MSVFFLIFTALAGLVMVMGLGFVVARMYHLATKEVAFVRTGMGGEKVVMDGGAIVLPVLHRTMTVNMNTLKLEVSRREKQSLITKDRMRVDVAATFFVRVKQDKESISAAAQTLGLKTMHPETLRELIEDKFVDSLRSTAATMGMKELQDRRSDFVNAVQNAVAEDLKKNGLELEAVTLTSLDQTSKEHFNPDNAFDAEGLALLTAETEGRRKERNEIEQDTEIAVRSKNLEAERQRLDIERDQQNAASAQKTEMARFEALRHREAQEARIESDRLVEEARIAAQRQVESAEITKQLQLREQKIAADASALQLEARQRQDIEVANQTAAIAIARKSQEQSEADALANEARSKAVQAEQMVVTAKETAIAERDKAISLIDARRLVEQEAIAVTVKAQADREAAENQAAAIRINAEANQFAALAEAAGIAAINDARNTLGAAQIDLQMRLRLIDALPSILEQTTKPMEKIDSIRIFQLGGAAPGGAADLVGNGAGHVLGNGAGGASLPEQAVNSALQYQMARPLIDAIMKDAGLNNPSITGIAQTLAEMSTGGKATTVDAVDVAAQEVQQSEDAIASGAGVGADAGSRRKL